MQLEEIKIGWKTLATILNLIRKAVNSNAPLKGHGISLHASESGTIISADPKTDDQTNAIGNLLEGGWIDVDVMDKDCNKKTIQVWGKESQ